MVPFAIPFPDISPELFSIEIGGFTFALRWYALAYIAGILGGFALARLAMLRGAWWPAGQPPVTGADLEDLVTWVVLGIILGGRLGFVLFYQPGYYLANPAEILAVWQGGMSFHGGALGVLVALGIWGRRKGRPVLSLWDLGALVAPLGLFFGRVANFINAELWGRPTDLPWGVIFPGAAAQDCPGVAGLCARHPSQLYEAILEGAVLLLVLWIVAARGGLRRPGLIFGLFLAGYGAARSFVEYFRVADAQYITPDNPLGHVIGGPVWGLTMGQVLSLPMLVVGVAVIAWALRRRPRAA
ncbi:prolipoprotein diacylglyceryl transferase [Jannaschia aquimarina]|uniref:Phosphatidylglycerol--prolipoprotein diacylglyceryl transferase n=1 Tax=Jannaschia aquimarina TaxID=935700 RepID=A0A0D1D9T7_9RHOB|nr:prolipoprotein diacylglyceryl transferase [Jannaschia aquimarina]KIT16658.1 Prolipoprotein diacylglyceryl transferase [Jannaschia aquimarina]SNS93112.1 phosphatidylglycerol:prolipoprotein diacylglycerol transferase [Jannaschia aquimarina]